MSSTRIQIVTLNDDDSATMASWPINELEATLYREMLTDDLERPPDESVYTTQGVTAIDAASSVSGHCVAL